MIIWELPHSCQLRVVTFATGRSAGAGPFLGVKNAAHLELHPPDYNRFVVSGVSDLTHLGDRTLATGHSAGVDPFLGVKIAAHLELHPLDYN